MEGLEVAGLRKEKLRCLRSLSVYVYFNIKEITNMQEIITIVSGLPRSGTSMMMKMLEAGGMEAVVDHIRKPDEDNPAGYYEFEKVKKIKEDTSWLERIKGRAVKMISMLLYDLPSNNYYKIIFMKRNMQEILASQRTMLNRRGVKDKKSDEDMERFFNKHLNDIHKWIKDQPNIDVLYVDYNDTIKDPLKSVQRVNEFLGNTLDAGKMATAIDKLLYRNRRTA